jgi:hypothetical protein
MWGRYALDAYGSTEGVIIATQTWDYGDMTFVPYINFLEFVPEADYAKWSRDNSFRPPILSLDEVIPGERYVVILTNFLGGALVRYVTDDLITITSLRNDRLNINIPQMTFYGRAGYIIDFAAFTHSFFTEKMLWQAIDNSGFEYTDWLARKETGGEAPVLHIYVEPKKPDFDNEDKLSELIHGQLKRLNRDYADLESFFGYRPLRVTLLPAGVFNNYMTLKRNAGADLAHLKPPHMNPSDSIMETLLSGKLPAAIRPSSSQELKTQI